MKRTLLGLCFLATLVLAAGCDSDEGGEASVTPSASASATGTATATATVTSTAAATPTELESLPRSVWLIDTTSGEVHTLFDDPDHVPWGVGWVGSDAVRIGLPSGDTQVFGGDGRPTSASGPACEPADEGIVVDGVTWPDVENCSDVSPTGRYALYSENVGDDLSWDQWVVDLQTGERRLLQEHMRHCGGCDGRHGPQWSPDDRFVLIPELIDQGRVYLSDPSTGMTVAVGQGTDVVYRPLWSPTGDGTFLVDTEDGPALIDASTGATRILPLAWPVGFDTSGMFVYSPSGEVLGESGETSVLNIETGEMTVLPGVTPWYSLRGNTPVVAASAEGFTAVLPGAECSGSTIHATGREPTCLPGTSGGAPAPGGQSVALARLVPGGGATYAGIPFPEYEIVLFDLATEEVTVIAEGIYSGEDYPNLRLPPRLEWNEAGTLLLVWQQFAGI